MKPKYLWLAAVIMLALLIAMLWRYSFLSSDKARIGIANGAFLVQAPSSQTLYWGEKEKFTDVGLKINAITWQKAFNISDIIENNTIKTWAGLKARRLQTGFYAINLGADRIYFFDSTFTEGLDASQPIDFNSDWIILQKSSLLPERWPEPRKGWVVLNSGTLSNRIKDLSAESKKPIIRPTSAGTVWLEKTPQTDWQVLLPQ